MTITEFLRARITDDQAVAELLMFETGNDWWVDGPALVSGKHWVYSTGEKFERREVADHIVRWQPATIIKECQAKLRILDFHESWPVLAEQQPAMETAGSFGDVNTYTIRMSQQISWLTQQEYRSRFGDEPPTTMIVRAMASVYADHPDYLEEWRL